jgi:putative endonuclease
MAYHVYIIYSRRLNKYYVGYTEDLELRLMQHNCGHYAASYTMQTNDWVIFHSIPCTNKTQCIRIESHIKRMKSTVYIENLKKYTEITTKLLEMY